MITIDANPLLGTFLHAFGAICAALCYTPQSKLRGWSWQTYWITQAAFCWVILPVVGAVLTIPNINDVLMAAPRKAMLVTFLLGAAYGVGGTAFGVAIKHIGFSLTYAIAIGISCVLGTFSGPLLRGQLAEILDKPGSSWVMAGVFIGLLGTLMCGLAGRMKEVELQKDTQGLNQSFKLGKGLLLCCVAGILSSVYGIAVNDTGAPIAQTAAEFGAGHWQTNIVYIFSNTGAFITTAVYCIWLIRKENTLHEFKGLGVLGANYWLALLTGCMWYGQFFFYGLAHVRMGEFKFSSWAIHMIMLILFSSLAGVAMKEWHGRRRRTQLAITVALFVLVAAVTILARGNYIGQKKEEAAIKRFGWVVELLPDKVKEYKKLHTDVWPGVLDKIKECNVENYSIYLRQFDDGKYYLFSYLEYTGRDFDADMARMAEDKTTQKWWSFPYFGENGQPFRFNVSSDRSVATLVV